jgi:phage FluMu protein Com
MMADARFINHVQPMCPECKNILAFKTLEHVNGYLPLDGKSHAEKCSLHGLDMFMRAQFFDVWTEPQ